VLMRFGNKTVVQKRALRSIGIALLTNISDNALIRFGNKMEVPQGGPMSTGTDSLSSRRSNGGHNCLRTQ
jgi:hypothetical protein